MTHGMPQNHIWILAAGVTVINQQHYCPCNNLTHPNNAFPPSLILLEITTTVNQEMYLTQLVVNTYNIPLLSGMASSVKVSVHVAAMENLLHGSTWIRSYQT